MNAMALQQVPKLMIQNKPFTGSAFNKGPMTTRPARMAPMFMNR